MQLIFENAFDFKLKNSNQKSKTNDEKFNNRNKIKTFVVDKFDEKKPKKYYVVNENLKYYNSKNFHENEKISISFTIFVTIIKTFESRYRRYKKSFLFNNELYRHIRVDCHFQIDDVVKKNFANTLSKLFNVAISFFTLVIVVYSINIIDVIKNFDTKTFNHFVIN